MGLANTGDTHRTEGTTDAKLILESGGSRWTQMQCRQPHGLRLSAPGACKLPSSTHIISVFLPAPGYWEGVRSAISSVNATRGRAPVGPYHPSLVPFRRRRRSIRRRPWSIRST